MQSAMQKSRSQPATHPTHKHAILVPRADSSSTVVTNATAQTTSSQRSAGRGDAARSTFANFSRQMNKSLWKEKSLSTGRGLSVNAQTSAHRERGSIMSLENADDLTMAVKLDSRQVLKAFRYIGGLNGIQLDELYGHVETIRNEQVRKPLLKDLDEIFARFDKDNNGTIDVMEFERMVNSSTLMQRAVYEILKEEDSNDDDYIYIEGDIGISSECAEIVSIGLVLLNVFNAAVAIDNSPEWEGWQWIELVFVCFFTLELVFRFRVSARNMYFSRASADRGRKTIRCNTQASGLSGSTIKHVVTESPRFCMNFIAKCGYFALVPTNLLDVLATIVGWIEMTVYIYERASGRELGDSGFFWTLRRLRIFRLTRLVRLVRVIFFIQDLRTMLLGILSGIRSVLWGFLFIALIVFLWAIFLRQSVVAKWSDDDEGLLKAVFPSMTQSMLVVFRCMVLGTDGTCMHNKNESVVLMLSDQLGWLFDSVWAVTQVFIWFGIFNVIAASFVVQACDHAAQVRDSVLSAYAREDEVRLESLDKLLRTLIYPDREQSEPRDKYAAEVAKMVQKNHPDAAEKIPHLERQVVDFARGIQESKALLQNAMNKYEAREVQDCRSLQNTPSAKTYVVDGEEILCVCKEDASISNSCGLPSAPVSGVEVLLLQESETLPELVQEAHELQAKVKSIIYPDSEWARTFRSGNSGNIWKQSKGLCDEAVDPGPKSVERAEQKVVMKYHGSFHRNRDYSRLALIYDSVNHLIEALPHFLRYRIETDGMKVAAVENRFVHPHPLGWRDITLLLKVLVPSSGRYHIMEIQMQLRGLSECREQNHRIYEEMRAVLPEDVVHTILDRLVTDTTLDLGITKMEWTQCLHNKEVRHLLDGLGVPAGLVCRKRLFDLVDIDGSGTVTSSELQEIMRLYRTPAQALELAGCHLRVKEVQRHAQMKLGPQLTTLMKHVVINGYIVEELINDLVEACVKENGRSFQQEFHSRAQARMSRYGGGGGGRKASTGSIDGLRRSTARIVGINGVDFDTASFAPASFALPAASLALASWNPTATQSMAAWSKAPQRISRSDLRCAAPFGNARTARSDMSFPSREATADGHLSAGSEHCMPIPENFPVAEDLPASPVPNRPTLSPDHHTGFRDLFANDYAGPSSGDTPVLWQEETDDFSGMENFSGILDIDSMLDRSSKRSYDGVDSCSSL